MPLGDRILLALSRSPESDDYHDNYTGTTVSEPLDLLHRTYPDLDELVAGKRVLDFGCGPGYQSIALADKYDCSVVGIDTNERTLQDAVYNAKEHGIDNERVSFVDRISPDMIGKFDVVISQNSFEHFDYPEETLSEISRLLRDTGVVLVTFGPPWLAPYGSHMHFFCKVPWINIVFSERSVMKVRSLYRGDGATRYEDVESGLNRMTITKFESIVSSCGLSIKRHNYECVKKMNWLAKIPLVRELFINHVTVLLSKTI